MHLFTSVEQLVGHTPLLHAQRLQAALGLRADLYLKLERSNPTGSAKDRAAIFMLDDAERRGLIGPGATVIEPTSGNTGIGLAAVCAARGYRAVIVMPDTMSVERQQLMRAYGAQLVLSDGKKGMSGAIALAQQLHAQMPNSFIPDQFANPANAAAHEATTGVEIWEDTDGTVDAFVAGIGTGGTITGVGRYLKRQNPAIRIVGVEPAASPVLSGGRSGPHGLQGIGAGFVPAVLDPEISDELICVTEDEAYAAARLLARKEGVLTGISSGAALHAAAVLAQRPEWAGRRIVVLLPDTGERYLSTPLYAGD